ncbi:hypothetical protein Tco_1012305, partial [Tanacetum coccineum]
MVNWFRLKRKKQDDLGGVSQDDESDTYTRQYGRGATVGAKLSVKLILDGLNDSQQKVSGEAMNDADMSAVIHVEETKSAREIVLKNKVESLEAKVEKLQLDHDKMAVFFENFKKIQPELVPPTPDAKEDPSDVAIDGEHMDTIDPPSHESEITSPYGSEKKGDGLDGAKANQ